MKLMTLGYLRQDGKTLMLHRTKKEDDVHEGKWNGLGGKLEPAEAPEECIMREMKEESGLTVSDPVLMGIITFPSFADGEDYYVFIYEMRRYEGSLIDSREGELAWIPDEKLEDLNLWEGDRLFFAWMRERRFFSAKMVYEDGRLKSHDVVFHGTS